MKDVKSIGVIPRRDGASQAFHVVQIMGYVQFNKNHLIKCNHKIKCLKDNEWINTGLIEPLSQKDFEEYGMEDLSPLTIPTNKVVKTMDFDRVEGDGKIYRKTIDVNKYRKINGIKTI